MQDFLFSPLSVRLIIFTERIVMKRIIFTLFFVALSTFCAPAYNGFCSVPLADLLGGPINDFFSTKPIEKAYMQLPHGETRGTLNSPRIAQLLFNQPVIIREQRGKEIKIEIPYLTYSSGKHSHFTYWTLAHNITPLTNENKAYIPLNKNNIFILRYPVTLKGITYSAGTQFVQLKKQKHKTQIYIYNTATKNAEKIWIKNSLGITPPKDFKDKQQLLVQLCKEWAHQNKGITPYVFGGLSIGKPLQKDVFTKRHATYTKRTSSTFFVRENSSSPHFGIDCSRIFTRAAQMVDIPLHATNTKELKRVLQPLKRGEDIENGDIIIWNGHVAMVSDVKKGLLVEARSYESGYGKVHEIPYQKELKGITSTKKLVDAHFSKSRITRLNKDGEKIHFIYDLEILKLSSLKA